MKGKWIIAVCILFVSSFLLPVRSFGQCPMCKATLETNLQNGGSTGKGINKGIFYMLFTPYILVGTIGFVWWRNRQSSEPKEEETEEV